MSVMKSAFSTPYQPQTVLPRRETDRSLSAVNDRPLTRFGHFSNDPSIQRPLVQAVAQDAKILQSHLIEASRQSLRTPVSKENPQPAWLNQLRELRHNPIWNKSLGDYVLERNPAIVQRLREQYSQRTLLLEATSSQVQQAVQAGGGDQGYQKSNSSFADLEANVSGMDANARAVFVGSGPQPNSVLAYAEKAGHVTGIDIDPVAITHTQEKYKAQKSKIDFLEANGQTFDYGKVGATHVGIAVMVPEKDKILKQIAKTAPLGCTVIVRSTKNLKATMYESFDESKIPPNMEKIATIEGNNDNITHAVILRKTSKFPQPRMNATLSTPATNGLSPNCSVGLGKLNCFA